MNEVIKKALNELLLQRHIVLQVVQPSGTTIWFLVFKWQQGYFNTAESVEFNTVEGIDISEFMEKNAAMYRSNSEFRSQLERFIEENPVIRCEFTNKSIWYKWQITGKDNKSV